MRFSVKERLLLLNNMPAEGNLQTLRAIRHLSDKLDFIESEKAQLEFRRDGESIKWNPDHDVPVEIEITDGDREIVKMAFNQRDLAETLTMDHLALYDRFQQVETLPFPKQA